MSDNLSNDAPIFPIYLSRHQVSKLTHILKDAEFPKQFSAEYRKERTEEKDELRVIIQKQFSEKFDQIMKDGTREENGIIRLPVFDKGHSRKFTYNCRECGDSLTIYSDNGHLAYQYWKENHSHNSVTNSTSTSKQQEPIVR